MARSDTFFALLERARLSFGEARAGQLEAVLEQVAADLDTLSEFTLDPGDGP